MSNLWLTLQMAGTDNSPWRVAVPQNRPCFQYRRVCWLEIFLWSESAFAHYMGCVFCGCGIQNSIIKVSNAINKKQHCKISHLFWEETFFEKTLENWFRKRWSEKKEKGCSHFSPLSWCWSDCKTAQTSLDLLSFVTRTTMVLWKVLDPGEACYCQRPKEREGMEGKKSKDFLSLSGCLDPLALVHFICWSEDAQTITDIDVHGSWIREWHWHEHFRFLCLAEVEEAIILPRASLPFRERERERHMMKMSKRGSLFRIFPARVSRQF